MSIMVILSGFFIRKLIWNAISCHFHMKGIPKGLCSFGQVKVTPHRVGRCRNATEGTDPIRGTALAGVGQRPTYEGAFSCKAFP